MAATLDRVTETVVCVLELGIGSLMAVGWLKENGTVINESLCSTEQGALKVKVSQCEQVY